MTRLRALLLLTLLFATATVFAQTTIPGTRPPCVQVSTSAPFNGVGFNHLVSVTNRCTQTITCSVRTNVNPSPQTITVAQNQTETVNTFLGSPAQLFTPTVDCRTQ